MFRCHSLRISTALAALIFGLGAIMNTSAPARGAEPQSAKPAPKRILILGGTGFLGPAIVDAAKARGHSLTLFNRGRTEKRIGLIDGVEHLYGNRDPNLPADETKDEQGNYINPSPRGLEALQGKTWDAVVDTSGQYRRIVKASAELLAPNVKQYVYVSSISAYASNARPNEDESGDTASVADPDVETMGAQFENYGGLKALCEQTIESILPGRTTVVRPGLIVGPGDPTDRFTYWPLRIAKGGEVLAPGKADDPVQLIDVRDLAEWIVLLIENNTTGIFNAINPGPNKLTMGEVLEACKKAAKSDATLTWASAEFLEQQQVSPWGDMPLWIPHEGDYAGFHLRSNAKAAAAGLKMRPVEDTVAAILNWWPKELERRVRVTAEMQSKHVGQPVPQMPDPRELRAGIKPDRETQVLKLWRQSQVKSDS